MAKYYKKKFGNQSNNQNTRIKLPNKYKGEMFGYVEQMTGAYRCLVTCEDKKVRICRIPGGKRKHMWIRQGMIIIVKPWDLEGDKKADVVYKYPKGRDDYLRSKGFLKKLEGETETNDEKEIEEQNNVEEKTEESLDKEKKADEA